MNEVSLKKLQERLRQIGPLLHEWVRKESGDPNLSLTDYFRDRPGTKFPNRILNPDRGDINISLHGPLFNNIVHTHDFFEVIYVAKGTVDDQIGENIYHLKENEAILHVPGLSHSIVSCGEDDILINIDFHETVFSRSIYRTFFGNFQFFIEEGGKGEKRSNEFFLFRNNSKKVETIMDLLIDEYFQKESYSQIVLESVLTLLFAEFVRGNFKTEETDFEEETKKYILDNIATATLEKVARHFNYHPKYFCSLVKKKTGKSFKKILTEYRLKKSELYLKYTALSNDAISEEVGYRDDVSFYNNFKKAYGMTPSAYRKIYAESLEKGETMIRLSEEL